MNIKELNKMEYNDRENFKFEMLKKYAAIFKKNNYKVEEIKKDCTFCMVIELNDDQSIFIRPFDNKSYASISPSKINKDLYLKNKRLEIGFSAVKEPEKLFQDILKRLINSEFAIDQWNEIKERQSKLNDHKAYIENKIAKYEKIFDFRIHNDDRVSFYDEGFSLDINLSNYNEIKFYGLSDEQAIKLIKYIKTLKED